MKLHEARRDLYRRLAKEQGYKSRAAFKLKEANDKYDFIHVGDRVVDFGAAPGGWLQVSSEFVGDSGLVVGVDRDMISLRNRNIRTLKIDVYEESVEEKVAELLGRKADVVLSDLAPSVMGAWDLDHNRQVELTLRVLQLSHKLLRIRGNGFFKVFEGERSRETRAQFARRFEVVRVMKPRASRNAASELYYFCMGWRDTSGDNPETALTAETNSE